MICVVDSPLTLMSVAAQYGWPLTVPSCACVPAEAAALPMVCMMRDAEMPIERSASEARGCRPHLRIAASGVATGGSSVDFASALFGRRRRLVGDGGRDEDRVVAQAIGLVVDGRVVGLDRLVVVEERGVVVDRQPLGGGEQPVSASCSGAGSSATSCAVSSASTSSASVPTVAPPQAPTVRRDRDREQPLLGRTNVHGSPRMRAFCSRERGSLQQARCRPRSRRIPRTAGDGV